MQTNPRNVVTNLFQVTNTSSEPIEFISELVLPEGWKPITQDFIFTVDAGQSQTRLLSFFIPQMAKAGLYEIPCVVKARNIPSISDFFIIHVNVQAVTSISLQILNAPEFVIAGNEYRTDFMVLNESNQPVDVKIEPASSQNFLFNIDSSEVHLEAAESKTITITFFTNSDLITKTIEQLSITAYVVQNPEIISQEKHKVDIIPRIYGSKDIYHRLPVILTFNHIATKVDGWDTGFQTKISGKGYIDESKSKYLSFLAKAPDQRSIALFGQYDEYNILYYTENYDIGAGDLNFNLSPLTEPGFSARGVELKTRINQFQFGGYAGNTRMTVDEENQNAAYINFNINNKNIISLNYLSKSLNEDLYQIWSVNSEFMAVSDTSLVLEYAGSAGNNNNSGSDHAFLFDMLKNKESYNLKIKSIYANPDFQGYHKDQKFLSMAGSYEINKTWRISGDFVFDRKNLDLDMDVGTAPERKYYRIRLNHITPRRTSFFIDLIQENRMDVQINPKFNFFENSARFGTNFSYKKLSFIIMAETGVAENNLTGKESSFQRYTLSSNYSYDSRRSGSGYITYDTSNDYEGLDRQKISYGLNLKSKIGDRSSLAVSSQSSKRFESENETDHNFKASLEHTIDSNWKLLDQSEIRAEILKSKTSNSYQADGTSIKMSWTIPFNVPVCRKKDFGSVKGRVYDKTTNIPIPDVVIKIDGQIAVTDKNGEYIFPNLPTGPEYLSSNSSNIKGNRIFYDKMPFQIFIKSGETLIADLPVVEPASFSGELKVYEFKTPGSEFDVISESSKKISSPNKDNIIEPEKFLELVESNVIPNALIEMIQGSQITRRLTDQKGHFSFDALVPGKYVLKIKGVQIPDYHRLEKEEFEVELSRNEHKEMEIKVLPIKRSIQMLPSVPILIEENSK